MRHPLHGASLKDLPEASAKPSPPKSHATTTRSSAAPKANLGRVVTKHYSWNWDEVASSEGAAWSETWSYAADGSLLGRERVSRTKRSARPTISTDPRAGAIMREELGLEPHRQMGGPHW
jgi:hypothetical protein